MPQQRQEEMTKKFFRRIWQYCYWTATGIFWYVRDLTIYKNLLKKNKLKSSFFLFPKIFDKHPSAHTFDKHYVYMDRWAFWHILNAKPAEHMDVGSSIRFLSMVSAVTQLKFVDIRPVKLDFDNFQCIKGSILSLPFNDNSIKSLSCLHVAEHIGLGRYGDPLDPLGTQKACQELARVLAPGGKLYFALPVGRSAVYFNAHRVHYPLDILDYFKNLKLVSFAAVGDDGHFDPFAKLQDYQTSRYACGCFEFVK